MDEYRKYWADRVKEVGEIKSATSLGNTYPEIMRPVLAGLNRSSARLIYDFACGPGLIVPLVEELWPNARYVGLDISKPMLKYASKEYPELEWVLVDGPEYPNEQADIILAHSLFTHIYREDALDYLEATKSALKPDGVASISIHVGEQWNEIKRIDYRAEDFELLLKSAGFNIMGVYVHPNMVPTGTSHLHQVFYRCSPSS